MAQPKLSWKNLTTGVFFLLAIVILAAALLIVGTNQNIFSRTFTVHTYLPDTQSLTTGTSVTLSGIEIGVIKAIELDTYEGQNVVRFDLRLRKKHQPRITTSSRAVVKSIGILGDKFLEVTLGVAGEPPVKDGAVIPGETATAWEAVARDVSNSLSASLNRIESLLNKMDSGQGTMGVLLNDSTLAVRLVSTIENVDADLKAIRSRQGTLGRLIYDPAVYDHLSRTMANLDRVSGQLADGGGSLGRMIQDSTLYVSAASAAVGADTVLSRLNAGQGTAGQLLNDEKAYDELHRAIQDLRLLLIDMQANPEKYVRFSVF